jgi:hypothetical protein
MKYEVIGIDAAFANMGLARAELVIDRGQVVIIGKDLHLLSTERMDKKVVRKSSDDLRRAKSLVEGMQAFTQTATMAFAEVPSGSQSASAARALGIAVGVLGACTVPLIEVSPMEVKKLFSPDGKRKVTKLEIIAWAMKQWPHMPWLTCRGKPTQANEHLADAMATIVAGTRTPEFKQAISFHHAIPDTPSNRPASNRRAVYGL